MGRQWYQRKYMGLQFPLSFGRHHNSKIWHSSDTQVLVWPATAGLVLEAGLPLWPSTGMGLSSVATERTGSTASARKRGLLRLSPRPGTDGGDTVEPPLLAELLSSVRTLCLQTTPLNRRAPPGDSTGAWSRGMLTLRLTLTMVEPTPDTAMAGLDTVMAVMARGPQTLRLTLTTAMVEPTLPDTALAVLDTAMVVLATVMAVMARDPQTLRLMPTTAMAIRGKRVRHCWSQLSAPPGKEENLGPPQLHQRLPAPQVPQVPETEGKQAGGGGEPAYSRKCLGKDHGQQTSQHVQQCARQEAAVDLQLGEHHGEAGGDVQGGVQEDGHSQRLGSWV